MTHITPTGIAGQYLINGKVSVTEQNFKHAKLSLDEIRDFETYLRCVKQSSVVCNINTELNAMQNEE